MEEGFSGVRRCAGDLVSESKALVAPLLAV